ncbi:uncharacterized protein LOC124126857 isoform X2 [Haliotis rufescens]|uniref:uncharacterized protein LOC124126857 isoform X1 n=1 Tax=Haliotis rufescens TaxID=6454 RepID=UPI00201F12AB|nr:uncharacterized protein LOC124126857 isoform X1 [Haliotis rufescens]XP_048244382.1 uncharacterized protein LOC124126857 isoform X2 [Haliotis rufescens]
MAKARPTGIAFIVIYKFNIDLSTCKKNATSYTENKRSSPASHNEESDASSFSVQKEAEHIYAASPCTKICSNGTGPVEKPKAAVGEHNYCLDLPPKQKLPSTFSTHESFAEVGKQPQQTYLHGLMQAVASEDLEQVVTLLLSHPSSRNKINERVIQQLQSDCQELSSLSSPSVLREQSSLQNLTDSHDFIGQVFQEMKERAPFLLAVMSTVTGCMDGEIPLNKVAAITSSYSILMRMRNIHLTAWHKMVGCILIRGHLEDQSMVLLSNIGLCQSPTTKLRMMAQAVTQTKLNIVRSLQCNPLIKITGDNLDVYIRSSKVGSTKNDNKDLHMFASNIIFSKFADINLSTSPPPLSSTCINASDVLPNEDTLNKLSSAYIVLIGRILKDIPALSWLNIPTHIPHSHSKTASMKTEVHPMPLLFSNEAKYEECVKILDSYEDQLTELFTSAHGDQSALRELHVPVGGDQLTRVRLEGAKSLRALSPTPAKRFDDLGPFVIEWWHNKQDFLEKAYKALFSPRSIRQPGTLYFYKAKFNMTNVNGNVKRNFQSHHDLLVHVGKAVIVEQAREYFGITDDNNTALKNIPVDVFNLSLEEKTTASEAVLRAFLVHYGYLDLTFKDSCERMYLIFHVNADGTVVEEKSQFEPDEVYSYCQQLSHWALHLMELDDTAKEGDSDRLIHNAKMNIPFFFAHSSQSKYFVENIDFLIKVCYLLSPMMKELVLDTAFINTKGGISNCVEADLVQEHSVKNQKALIKQLGANKTKNAMITATGAASAIFKVCDNLRISLGVKRQSTRHSKRICISQIGSIQKSLNELRPFHHCAGRKCHGFKGIVSSPFRKFTKSSLFIRVQDIVFRLMKGDHIDMDDRCNQSDDTSDSVAAADDGDSDDELPPV